MRPALRLAFVASLAVPLPATAQLRTLCLSPTMDYCMSVWTWTWEYADSTTLSHAYFTVGVETFGSALTQPTWMVLDVANPFGDRRTVQMLEPAGFYDLQDNAPSDYSRGEPTVADIYRLQWGGMGGPWIGACDNRTDTPCHEVPEPGPLLLLATGLLGLAVTVRTGRRRDDPVVRARTHRTV